MNKKEDTLFDLFTKNPLILVQYLGREEVFILGFAGYIEGIDTLEQEIKKEDTLELFDNGLGEYILKCVWEEGQYDEFGRCEIADGWDMEVLCFKKYELTETEQN